jgi:acid phosphatase (class A)
MRPCSTGSAGRNIGVARGLREQGEELVTMRMMMLVISTGLLAACASAKTKAAETGAEDVKSANIREKVETGYLEAFARLDPTRLLPGPPPPGSAAARADADALGAAAAGRNGPDWARAATLNGVRTPAFQQALSCALGVTLSEQRTPALRRLLARTSVEMRALTDRAQAYFNRPRPFGADPAASCDPEAAGLGPSYPSGQAATGWLWALVLADVRPGRQRELLGFGADAGDVRISCRAHWLSDVADGRLLAAAVHQQMRALPAYKADVEAARREVATGRAPTCPGAAAGKEPMRNR